MSINEAINIQTTSINAIAPTTGNISIGASQTSGNLNIGCKGDEALTGRTTGVINIGSDLSATGQIRLGNNTSITPVFCRGSFTCNRFAVFNTSLSVEGNLTANAANLATSVGSTAVINILNGGGATSSGSVNIANGASQTTTVNIASGTGTGAVTIGGASNVVNLAKPPVLTYTTLPTFTATQIGYTLSSVLTVDTLTGATTIPTNPFSGTTFTLGVGVWSFNYAIRLKATVPLVTPCTVTGSYLSATLPTGQNNIGNYGLNWRRETVIIDNTLQYAYTGSAIIRNNTAGNVLTLAVRVDYTPAGSCQFAPLDTYVTVTRIA